MKKILLTFFALLSLNLAVFAYSETDLINIYDDWCKTGDEYSIFSKREREGLNSREDYDYGYKLCYNLRNKTEVLYQYLETNNLNTKEAQTSLLQLIASTYKVQGTIDMVIYNNLDKATSEYIEAAEIFCKAGDYENAESTMTEFINESGLDETKLVSCYKIRAQIREMLKNTTGAQEDCKKYIELMSK